MLLDDKKVNDLTLTDAHAHLPSKNVGLEAWLQGLAASNCTDLLVCANGPQEWQLLEAAVVAASSQPRQRLNIFAAKGLHPWSLNHWNDVEAESAFVELSETISRVDSPSNAIGECGLDFASKLSPQQKDRQIRYFSRQLQLAAEHDFPVIVHSVRALEATLKTIAAAPGNRPLMIHGFSGDKGVVARYLEVAAKRPIYFGVGGRLPDGLLAIPEDRLLIESDAETPGQLLKHHQLVAARRGEALVDLVYRNRRNLVALLGDRIGQIS